MSITNQRAMELLRGYYPGSQKVNRFIVEEHVRAFEGMEEDDYEMMIQRYREHDEKGNFVPSAKDLKPYRQVSRESRMSHLFFKAVLDFGWSEALRRGLSYGLGQGSDVNSRMVKYLEGCGYSESTKPYWGMLEWHGQFVDLVHAGEIVEAYQFAHHATEDYWYKDKAEFFESVGSERARKYFVYHRDKDRPPGNPTGFYAECLNRAKRKQEAQA